MNPDRPKYWSQGLERVAHSDGATVSFSDDWGVLTIRQDGDNCMVLLANKARILFDDLGYVLKGGITPVMHGGVVMSAFATLEKEDLGPMLA